MKVKLSKLQMTVLVIIACVHFFSSVCISLQAPFYPAEAEKKGATATEYGLVFGSFELVAFVFSPVFGKIVQKTGAKLMLSVGMLSSSCSIILFGLLDFVWNHDWFIILSFVLRITESLGSTAAVVAAFSLTGSMFSDIVATVFATMEMFYGVGYIIGPTLGGLLFGIGGFPLPFMFLGIVTAIVALCILLILPDINERTGSSRRSGGLLRILRIPSILIDSACIIGVSSSAGFYNATLEPHIREFHLKPVLVGLVFIISGGTYALIAPIFGRLIDKCVNPKSMMMMGAILNIISFSIVGPAPFVPLSKSLTISLVALVIHGLALAAINVSTFIDAIRSAISGGMPDDMSTYGLMSGIWSSSFALGAFIGPSVAGYLYDKVGFQSATLFVVFSHIILLIILVTYSLIGRKERYNTLLKTLPSTESIWNGYISGDQYTGNVVTCVHLLDPEKQSEIITQNGDYKYTNGYGAVFAN